MIWLAGYMIRAPMSLGKMTYSAGTGKVIYVRSICSMQGLARLHSGRVAAAGSNFPSVGNVVRSGLSAGLFFHSASGRSWPGV